MNYVGWSFNDDAGRAGYLVEDDNKNSIAWFEDAGAAIAYVEMAAALAAANAALAAVPVDELRRYMRYSDVPDHHHRYPDAEMQADRAIIALWLEQRPEVQP